MTLDYYINILFAVFMTALVAVFIVITVAGIVVFIRAMFYE